MNAPFSRGTALRLGALAGAAPAVGALGFANAAPGGLAGPAATAAESSSA
ncbi:hypothetical protein [Glycomyces tenuis]|nr:hypothetical protein [Glycomyces tenuis]